jgi:BON domain
MTRAIKIGNPKEVLMWKVLIMLVGGAVLAGLLSSELSAQEGGAERVGERIDRGLERLGEKLRSTWADIRQSVDELGVRGRVYGRIRWDKALADQAIEIQVQEKDLVVLTGTVPDESTRDKAVQLARDTVGVRDVVDQLQLAPRHEALESATKSPVPD